MKTRTNLSLLICILLTQAINAQEPKPKWAKGCIPEGYYYGVGIGETEQEALQKAKDDALIRSLPIIYQESYHEGKINMDSIKIIVEKDLTQRDYITESPAICIAEGKKVYALLCFTDQKKTSYTYYDDPVFEQELKSWNYGKYPVTARALLPGWAQFEKGSKTKAILFITAEAILLIGAATAESFRSSYESKVNTTHEKKYYSDKADDSKKICNGLLLAAGGLYLWNMIDGLAAKGKTGCNSAKNVRVSVAPFANPDNNGGGLTLALNF